MSPSRTEVTVAYRHLYRHLLRAVQYSKPARFVARDHMRRSFRKSTKDNYHATRISRTLEFLDAAAKSKGLEHKIVKNLMHVWWEQAKLSGPVMKKDVLALRKDAYRDFHHTIRMLDESMGLCLGHDSLAGYSR